MQTTAVHIDYLANPTADVKRFRLPYGEYHLEGAIRAHVEEGFDDAHWFSIHIAYPAEAARARRMKLEIGDRIFGYAELKKAQPSVEQAEEMLQEWCRRAKMPLEQTAWVPPKGLLPPASANTYRA